MRDLPDVSPAAVRARLAAFVAEQRAKPEGEWRESDALLLAHAEDVLESQARADLAEAEVKILEERGERLQ